MSTPPESLQQQPDRRSRSPTHSDVPALGPPQNNPLKRKTPPMELISLDDDCDRKPLVLPPGAQIPPEAAAEYTAGHVICGACGCSVSFKDDGDETAGATFTVKLWDAHRAVCTQQQQQHPQPPPHQSNSSNRPCPAPAFNSSQSMPVPLSPIDHRLVNASYGGPPTKRRRAKRTEEERIQYLKSDIYVAQFEAYRVLCASCDKWIRLRPNSTYCSIPWDAHRKSCLAKKKNVYALEERNTVFTKDPQVRKFDAERILCGMCDKWLHLPADDHPAAIQTWHQHRATCQSTVSALKNVMWVSAFSVKIHNIFRHLHLFFGTSFSASAEDRKPVLVSTTAPPRALRPLPSPEDPNHPHGSPLIHPPPSPNHPSLSAPPQPHPYSAYPPSSPTPTRLPHPDAPHLILDLSPTNYAAPHESRRRNAEQRAATLRADVLIREVEPNRVFCSLCTKWVQLRQDSSYCAYPWLQHRGKCLARYQRRAQKASEIAALKNPSAKRSGPLSNPSLRRQDSIEDGDEPESEEGVAIAGSSNPEASRALHRHRVAPAHAPHPPRAIPAGYAAASSARPLLPHPGMWGPPPPGHPHPHAHGHPYPHPHPQGHPHSQPSTSTQQQQSQSEDADAEGTDDVDADGDSYMESEGATPTRGFLNGNGNNHGPTNGVPNGYHHGHGAQNGGQNASVILRRAVPASLADLDSPGGRRNFIFASVDYLFRTTYEASDDMAVSALLTYLNAAMPTDKHEDFDTGEVVRAASALAAREKERYVLEGDMLRFLGHSHAMPGC
ncbi:hypothetical protein R3P38DRAFT_3566271 [Favolaschia claudopus]|uniref:Uncharacterized protein n=1 Tax=Favolaschia claudopus TaxID=2862362 RepID=A0AAW0DUH0_9AGAR